MDNEKLLKAAMALVSIVIDEVAAPDDWDRMKRYVGEGFATVNVDASSRSRVLFTLDGAPMVTVDLRTLMGREP